MQENFFILAGYLGTKPEIRYLPAGTPVANAQLAQTMRFQKDGEPHEHTNWFNLTFYGERLVGVAQTFEKGDNIHVTGTVEYRQWETPAGAKRSVCEVSVCRCHRVAGHDDAQQVPTLSEVGETNIDRRGTESGNALDSDDDWVI